MATAAQSPICVRIILSTSTAIICGDTQTVSRLSAAHGHTCSGVHMFRCSGVCCRTCGWFLHASYTTFRMCSFPSSVSVRAFRISWNLKGSDAGLDSEPLVFCWTCSDKYCEEPALSSLLEGQNQTTETLSLTLFLGLECVSNQRTDY